MWLEVNKMFYILSAVTWASETWKKINVTFLWEKIVHSKTETLAKL